MIHDIKIESTFILGTFIHTIGKTNKRKVWEMKTNLHNNKIQYWWWLHYHHHRITVKSCINKKKRIDNCIWIRNNHKSWKRKEKNRNDYRMNQKVKPSSKTFSLKKITTTIIIFNIHIYNRKIQLNNQKKKKSLYSVMTLKLIEQNNIRIKKKKRKWI